MKTFYKAEYQRHRRSPIYIVIAIHHHLFAFCYRLFDTDDGPVHILHQKRIVKLLQLWPEKRLRIRESREATLHQKRREVPVDTQQFTHLFDTIRIPIRFYNPAFLHKTKVRKNR